MALSWRQIQKGNYTSIHELSDFLELSAGNRSRLHTSPRFILNLPKRLAEKIAKNDLEDPLFKQFVPTVEETMIADGFVADPVCDKSFRKGKKILHKYKGRALWLTSSACAMHCRFCFRQNFPYESDSDHSEELAYLREHTDIKEVVLSGGDPLSLSNDSLKLLFDAFDSMPHIQRIRFHTRFPIGIPERIDSGFLELLSNVKKQVYFVVHCNHARELDEEVIQALRKVASMGIPLLTSSVLLKGVNDEESTFLELCETLSNAGIIPYYLNLLDPVEGAGHFAVSEERGRELIRYVQERLSGYGVPRLIREEPGSPSKTFKVSDLINCY